MECTAILRGFGAVEEIVVANDAGDTQPVIAEDAGAAALPGIPVLRHLPPGVDCRFVTPEGEREDLARLGEALEPLDRDESVDVVEEWPELGGDIEILPLSPPWRARPRR